MRLCEARGWYEPDKSIESRIYCFGDEGGQGDASDVEAGRQGMGPAASGPQKSLGAKSDVADYPKDDSDRRVQSTGSTTNVNIDRSQPSVSTDRGRVYGTQANLDKAVERGDINITPSPIDSYTPGTSEARSAFTSAGGILSQDRSGQPAAGPGLPDSDIFSPTNITGQVFQTPFQQSVMTPQQRMASAYIDAAVRGFRTDKPMALADRSVVGLMSPMEAVQNSFMNDIFDFSRPMTEIRPESPAEQITQSARALTAEQTNLENLLDAIQQRESGTTGGLVSDFDEERIEGSAGEIGRFQVRPSTAVNPGYGITPIAETEEEARILLNDPTISRNFAREYLQAAQREFPGDTSRQILSYNRGIAGASRVEDPLSDEYVQGVLSNLDTRQTAPAPVADQGIASVVPQEPFYNLDRTITDEQLAERSQAIEAEQAKQARREGLAQFPFAAPQEDPISGAQDLREVLGRQDIFAAPTYDAADLAEARRNLERAQASTPNEFGFRTGLPTTFGDTGIPTGIGVLEGAANALFNPEASVANAISRFGIEGKGGRLQVIQANGRTAAYDPVSNIVYDTNPFDFSGTTPEIQALYDRKTREEERRDQGRGGDDPILPPLLPEDPMAEQEPEEYMGRDVIGGGTPTGYQPRGPLQISYTGLPTLAPVVLRPTFQSRAPFSPLFGNLGQPRRS